MIGYLTSYLRLSGQLLDYPLEFLHLSEVETRPLLHRGTPLLPLYFQDPLFGLPHQLLEPICRPHLLLPLHRRKQPLFDISEYILGRLSLSRSLFLPVVITVVVTAFDIFP
jgi:hypothetical protein